MGDMDLLKPVAMAGIPCAVMTRPGVPSLYSRHARTRLPWEDFSKDPEALLETLLRFGKAQNARPVLFYEEDAQPLFVSRHRERLKEAFRFVVADATLVEDLSTRRGFKTWRSVMACRCRRRSIFIPSPPSRKTSTLPSRSSSSH